MRPTPFDAPRQAGFTIIEMIVAMVLFGILATALIPLLQLPMSAYADASRRADLGSELDTAVTKMKDDLGQAVPGSIRVLQLPSGVQYLEYMEVRATGRFRTAAGGPAVCPATCNGIAANRERLENGVADNCASTLGPLLPGTSASGNPVVGDQVIVNPLGTGVSPWTSQRATLQAVPAAPVQGSTCVRLTAATSFIHPTANKYLYLASTPVSYECNPSTGRLTRYWGYAFPTLAAGGIQRTTFAGVTSAPVSTRVVGCTFFKNPAVKVGTGYIVTVALQLGRTVDGALITEKADGIFEFGEREVPFK